MALETELKLSIAPVHLRRLKRHSLLKKLGASPAVNQKLYSVYYDTPALDLRNHAMALRLRRAGKQWLQTLKGGGGVQAGLHRRDEWETPVADEALDLDALEAAGGRLPRGVHKLLREAFVTDFSRNVRLLKFGGAEIELSMDRGEVRAGQQAFPICELELELKSGEPRQLFELALALLDIVPFELETVSKAEQGYRLLAGYEEAPVKAAVPKLDRDASLAEALQALAWSCLAHLQANLRGAMHGDDAEYLHQLRVALRRLRVVLRMAAQACPDAELAALGGEIAALGSGLGRLREWDVFVADVLRPLLARMPGHAGVEALLDACESQRAASYDALRSEEEARGLQRLLLRFAIWMNGDYWQREELQAGASGFAARRLRKLSKRFDSFARELDAADAAQLHALRILAKKLRYSAEFFSNFYDGKRAKSYLAALAGVQDVLGRINDAAVARRLLDGLFARPEPAARGEALDLARGWIAHELTDDLEALPGVLRRFGKQSVFWDK
jgi:inorganic triphosphatase YgiF